MRIAIVGAGFSGLSAAWNLPNCQISIFDAKGIGGGASGMAAGLMHPYVGEDGRRSLLATEGMAASNELIARVEEKLGEKIANRDGILRYMVTEEQKVRFLSHCQQYQDVEPHGENCFLVKSGVTVDCPRYLEGLWEMLSERGVKLIKEEISCLSSLKEFDQIIVAAGAGISAFPELHSLKFFTVKGQVLICKAPESLELPSKSSIYKGYIAPFGEKGCCHIGSTYERGICNDLPDLEFARTELFPKIVPLLAEVNQLEVVSCRAALRVIRKGHYFPIIAHIKQGLWAFGAMGSRGLLYHAYAGKLLADAIAAGNDLSLKTLAL